jgi:putative transposase
MVKQVLAANTLSPRAHWRYPPYAEIADPFERRRAVVQLHAEGWPVTSIAAYLHTSRARVYEVLQRGSSEGWARRPLPRAQVTGAQGDI